MREAEPDEALPSAAAPAPVAAERPTETAPSEPPSRQGLLDPATPSAYNFRFSASKAFKEKYERLAEVLGVENPVRDMERIFELAVDLALEKKDPERKRQRSLERARRQEAKDAARPRPDEVPAPAPVPAKPSASAAQPEAPSVPREPATSRDVPAAVRERVFARAEYQCEYRAPDGTRCSCRTKLELEHLRPFAVFRSHDERYLRAYCRRHNRFNAERFYGEEFIEEKIAAGVATLRRPTP